MSQKDPSYILVTGGAGYIGSYVNRKLHERGYQTVVLDNLSTGHKEAVTHGIFLEGDLQNSSLLEHIFTRFPIKAVMHFAGTLSVGESFEDPLKYYKNNVLATICLLEAMQKHKTSFLVFSSSASIFGTPQTELIAEDHPQHPLSPYGRSKAMIEQILQDMDTAYGLKYCSLRYFNVSGGDPHRTYKSYHLLQPHLIPAALRALQTPGKALPLFGTDYDTKDNTVIRDYIHIEDLSLAHLYGLEQLLQTKTSTCYNLGSGQGTSVKQVLSTIEKVTGSCIPILHQPRRKGDPSSCIANIDKASKELQWKPCYSSLEEIILHSLQSTT